MNLVDVELRLQRSAQQTRVMVSNRLFFPRLRAIEVQRDGAKAKPAPAMKAFDMIPGGAAEDPRLIPARQAPGSGSASCAWRRFINSRIWTGLCRWSLAPWARLRSPD